MIPSGVVRGQSVIVSRTNRHLVGGISSKTVLRAVVFVLWSNAVVNLTLLSKANPGFKNFRPSGLPNC